jgi:hypothetical protein
VHSTGNAVWADDFLIRGLRHLTKNSAAWTNRKPISGRHLVDTLDTSRHRVPFMVEAVVVCHHRDAAPASHRKPSPATQDGAANCSELDDGIPPIHPPTNSIPLLHTVPHAVSAQSPMLEGNQHLQRLLLVENHMPLPKNGCSHREGGAHALISGSRQNRNAPDLIEMGICAPSDRSSRSNQRTNAPFHIRQAPKMADAF